MKRVSGFALVVAAVAVVLIPQSVSRAGPLSLTLHVDSQNPAASDTGTGDPSSPFKSISGAVRAASLLRGRDIPITVLVHPGVYRETVRIRQPVILLGQPGAEIRGTDPWPAGWTPVGGYWTHAGAPAFRSHGMCAGRTKQCLEAVHVFSDGTPLRYVTGTPMTGQFTITPDRTVVLADSPEGHEIEVTARAYWVVIESDGVTVKGFRMRHAANDAQRGAIDAEGHSTITVADNELSDAHGAVLSVRNASRVKVTGNHISRGGQLGVGLSAVTDSLVQGNRIDENNTDAFSGGWEAGGLKASRALRLTINGNDVASNDGPGLWCDGDCQDVTISLNRVHDNAGAGIQYEISHRARISNNEVWKNGLFYRARPNAWGWGAGILIQNSDSCEVSGNILAWNRNGISVLEQPRGATHPVFSTRVHDNLIVSQDVAAGALLFSLSWMSDHTTDMFAASADNRGSSNKYGYSGLSESGSWRFAWDHHGYGRLGDFNVTPGEHGGAYLTRAEQDAVLSAKHIPLSP